MNKDSVEFMVREEEDWLQIRRIVLPGEPELLEQRDNDPQRTEAMLGVSEVDIESLDTQVLPSIQQNTLSGGEIVPRQEALAPAPSSDMQDTFPRADITRLPTSRLKQPSAFEEDVSHLPTRRLHKDAE